ncbi:MAG TPA: DUF5060 domain-containing protein, partial [Verrucomicrobiae bacterium]|nr:DUF5060 domain-containing protein [Verrucomicrobiae bacterium]
MKRRLFLIALLWSHFAFGQPTYPKLEASFTVGSLGAINPFDYTVADIRVTVGQPDGTTLSLPAFFDGGTTWRVRHTPTMTGVYTVRGITLNGQTLAVGNLQPGFWQVAGPPTARGFVRVDPAHPTRFMTSDGRSYFPFGHDNAWDINSTRTVASILAKMGGSRENWSRIWMNDWDGKNLDWPITAGAPLGKLNLTVAQKWDGIVAAAEQAGVQFQMTLQHHGQYSSTVDPEWPSNPYNVANGGFLSDATQFFTNATALAYTQRKLRYAVARWGYSPAVMAWELFNEVQFTDAAQAGKWNLVESWHNQMAAFLRAQDAYHHLITSSSDLTEPIWDATDYYTHHDYPNDYISSIRDAPTISGAQPVAPVFGAECGLDFTPHLGETPTAFAGLMAAQSGGEQIWYWDVIDTNSDYIPMRSAADFAARSGLGSHPALAKSQPAILSSQDGPLQISPGGGYNFASQSVFTIGQTVPAGIASLPSYLQGVYHKNMTPNGYTFLVNFPQAGTVSVQVVETASSGSSLTVQLDAQTTNVDFPSASSDTYTNFVLTMNVTPGPHTLVLTNAGLDWLVIGNITLNPYVPIVGAYEVSDPGFAALWLWHRTNIYLPNASAAVSAQATLSGLENGDYTGVWWDPASGGVLSNISFTVAGGADVTLSTPSILRSAALWAGHPPQASVTAPTLTETLGANAPPESLPLTITNSGGLPLAYNLSVTGVSPVVYQAVTSQTVGGPWYAWKDISGTGVDLGTNLAALTGKTAKDEGIAGPMNLGFNFPFFNGGQTPGMFSQIYVSPNGFITFSPFAGDTSAAKTFPSAAAPSNCVAWYWCDMKVAANSHIYAAQDPIAQTFTVQFQGMSPVTGGGALTGQIILKSSGEIVLQYQSIGGQTSVTVGVQNAAANAGLTVATALKTNLAILISPALWLQTAPTAGLIPGGSGAELPISFNTVGLAPGSYSATLNVNTSDANLPAESFPVTLNVSAALPAPVSFLSVSWLTWSQVTINWTNNAGNETGFEIWRATSPGGPYLLAGTAGAGASDFTDYSATSQTAYYYRVVATNAAGAAPASDAVGATTGLAPVDLWRQTNFGRTLNAGSAADGADPDHDGLPNLVEYAFASDPLAASPNPLTAVVTNGQWAVSFRRPHPAPADIHYIIETA